MYEIIINIYALCVAVASRFNDKVRKMWRGEHEAFRLLREKVQPGEVCPDPALLQLQSCASPL